MFRFTIRDVLWLTVVVALAVALVIARSRLKLWHSRAIQVTQYLERVEDLNVQWDGTAMTIDRHWPDRKQSK